MARASPALASFNAGELSPFIEGRTDTEKYGAGCKRLENYLTTIQGPATRRGGWKMVSAVKDSAKRAWLVRFEFGVGDAYMLEFGDLYVRFFYMHGQVVFGMTPYEVVSPYALADLAGTDGKFALRILQSADVLYIFSRSHQPRKLTRLAPTNWVFSLFEPEGGPFKTQNTTSTTIYADAQTGSVTLTASASVFTASMVGSLIQLEENSNESLKPWESNKTYSVGDRVRNDGKNYLAASGGTSGTGGPTHTKGTVFDGPAVSWTYEDPGYGYARITAYASGTSVSADVVSPLPFLVVGSGKATTNWAFGAWSSVEGWPTHAAFFRERLVIGRGFEGWVSVSGDFEDFNTRDASGLTVADSAFKFTLTSSTGINSMLWMDVFSPTSEALMIGTASAEFAVRSQTESQPFGPGNFTCQPVGKIGSSNVVPVRVGNAILFAQRSGKKLYDLTFDYYTGGGAGGSNDQTLYANHVLVGQIQQMAYQQEPFSVIWVLTATGDLVGMTYSREQYANPPHGGWHRHPLSDGVVECIETLPTSTRNEVWAIVRMVVNGVTRRYVCYMTPEDEIGVDPEQLLFCDIGATYNGYAATATTLTPGAGADVKDTEDVVFTAGASVFVPGDVGRALYRRYTFTDTDESGNPFTNYRTAKARITAYTSATQVLCFIEAAFPSLGAVPAGQWALTITTVSGLGYLEGKTLDVLPDGATHPQRTVVAGAIELQSEAAVVQVGMPMPARLQTMRLNAGAQDGTSQGKKGRIPQLSLRMLRTLGQRLGTKFGDGMQDMDFRETSNLMDNAPPLYTGDLPFDFPGDWDTNPWLCLEQSDPLPSTIVGIYPQVIVSDKG